MCLCTLLWRGKYVNKRVSRLGANISFYRTTSALCLALMAPNIHILTASRLSMDSTRVTCRGICLTGARTDRAGALARSPGHWSSPPPCHLFTGTVDQARFVSSGLDNQHHHLPQTCPNAQSGLETTWLLEAEGQYKTHIGGYYDS